MDILKKTEDTIGFEMKQEPRDSFERGTAVAFGSPDIEQLPEFRQRFNFWSAVAMGVCIAGTVSQPKQ